MGNLKVLIAFWPFTICMILTRWGIAKSTSLIIPMVHSLTELLFFCPSRFSFHQFTPRGTHSLNQWWISSCANELKYIACRQDRKYSIDPTADVQKKNHQQIDQQTLKELVSTFVAPVPPVLYQTSLIALVSHIFIFTLQRHYRDEIIFWCWAPWMIREQPCYNTRRDCLKFELHVIKTNRSYQTVQSGEQGTVEACGGRRERRGEYFGDTAWMHNAQWSCSSAAACLLSHTL
jgi:hypothetical protein